MAEGMRRASVGYALAPKKRASFIQASLVALAAERGIDLVMIERDRPLAEQGPFDCVLHKLHDEDWRRQLRDYSARHPHALVIDDPRAITRLHNRISMLETVTQLQASASGSFGIPKQTLIYDANIVSPMFLAASGLQFPVIAKPLVADGSARSHKMLLVFNEDGLRKLSPPIVLQEFVNHGAVIFKVYVVGDYVKCVKRKSLPDVTDNYHQSYLSFSQVSNLNNKDDKKDDMMMNLDDTEMPPFNLLSDIARGLRRATRLHLFNFDVIRDNRVGNRFLVIDINYFPGYAKMPNYEKVLTDFFWDVLNRKDKGFETLKKVNREKEARVLVGNNGCAEDEAALPVSPLKRDENENPIQV